jgi:phage-related protein
LLSSLINFLIDLINQIIALIQSIIDFLKSVGSFLMNVIGNAAIIVVAFVAITIGAFVYNRIR